MSGVTTASFATAALVASAAGAAAAAYGTYQQGQDAKKQGEYQSGVMRNNQILAQRAADDSRQRGELAKQTREASGRQLLGRQRATFAGNGVDINSGSAVDIQADTAANNKLDALMIRSNAEREALGYETQGMNFGASADLATLKGDSAARSGMIGAGSSLLSGFGSVAGKWYDLSSRGAFSTPADSSGGSVAWNTPRY